MSGSVERKDLPRVKMYMASRMEVLPKPLGPRMSEVLSVQISSYLEWLRKLVRLREEIIMN